MIRTKSFAAAAVIVALSACSGSAKVAAPTTVVTAAPAPLSTTTRATVAPTTAALTTVATTVAPTAPPSTTVVAVPVDDVDALKQTIKQAAIRGLIVDAHECIAAPLACDPIKITPVQGTARAILQRNVDRLIASGERSTTNEQDPSYLSVSSVELDPDRTRAVNLGCWWDTAILLIPKGNSDGSDKITNDKDSSNETRLTLVLEDGRWLIELAEILNTTPGRNTCPPK